MFIHQLSIQYCIIVYPTGLRDERRQSNSQRVSCSINCILPPGKSIIKLIFTLCLSPSFSGVFSNDIRYSKRILLYLVLFCPLKSNINSVLHIQFSWPLSCGKEKNITSCFLRSFTQQIKSFLSIFFNILTLHLFNFKYTMS